jgi:cellobiose epimerase
MMTRRPLPLLALFVLVGCATGTSDRPSETQVDGTGGDVPGVGGDGSGGGIGPAGGAGAPAGGAGGSTAGTGGSSNGAGGGAVDASDPALRTRLGAIQTRLRTLQTEVMAFWKTKGPDTTYGGFYGNLDRMGVKSSPTDKGLVQQTRHLWTFSNWYAMKEQTPEVKAIADNTYKFIVDHFYDGGTKQFQYKVNESGTSVVDSNKVLYAEGFAIYALSTYGRVFNVPAATTYAMDAFHAIDTRHDATFGGYDEHNDEGWLLSGSQKSTNMHIHMMEALTALYEATSDAAVKTRLEELVTIVRTKILQPSGYDAQEFKNDWTPNGAPLVSYGHDLETAWLLWKTGVVLGRPDDPDIRAASITMGSTSAAQGWDQAQGAVNENGVPGGSPSSTDKIWWVESEALEGFFQLYRWTGNTAYLDKLESTLKFIEEHQRDTANPGTEWFWGITATGAVNSRGDHKGEEWKCSYHNSRSLTFLDQWIADALL